MGTSDGTFYFEIGMSDGSEGIVGGAENVRAYAAEEFFRLFHRPLILDHTNRPADERAGADAAEQLVGRSEKVSEQSIDAGLVGCGTLFAVLKACGASESAGHVWYEPGLLLTFAAQVTGASAQGFFALPTDEGARARLLSFADAVLQQKASPEKGRLASFRRLGMLDPGDPAKVGTVVRDLYKTFAAPTRPAVDPAAAAWADAAQRSAAAAAAALNAGGGNRREGGNQARPPASP
eukprot:7377509-Prymnesium_polylepis.1